MFFLKNVTKSVTYTLYGDETFSPALLFFNRSRFFHFARLAVRFGAFTIQTELFAIRFGTLACQSQLLAIRFLIFLIFVLLCDIRSHFRTLTRRFAQLHRSRWNYLSATLNYSRAISVIFNKIELERVNLFWKEQKSTKGQIKWFWENLLEKVYRERNKKNL